MIIINRLIGANEQFKLFQSPYASYLTSPGGSLGLMTSAAALCSFGGPLSGHNPLSHASLQPPPMTSSQSVTSPSHSPLSVAALTSTSKSETDLVIVLQHFIEFFYENGPSPASFFRLFHSVRRVVTSQTTGPGFEPGHCQFLENICLLQT